MDEGATEPRMYAWIVPGRLAVAERPGGGGRSQRRARREREQAWWRDQGVTAIVSGMRTRHALLEYALDRFAVRWHPLLDEEQGRDELRRLVASVMELLEEGEGAVLVHCDTAGEWLTAADAALRVATRTAAGLPEALGQAAEDGLPVTSLTRSLVGAPTPAAA